MLILVRPSSTLQCTTSPIAAAGAIVGSSPGAGSSTMPRTTLSFFACAAACCGSANAASAASSASARVKETRRERVKAMVRLRNGTDPSLYGMVRPRPRRGLGLAPCRALGSVAATSQRP